MLGSPVLLVKSKAGDFGTDGGGFEKTRFV